MADEIVFQATLVDDVSPALDAMDAAMSGTRDAMAQMASGFSEMDGAMAGSQASIDSWASSMNAAGLEFFTFNDATQSFMSNMAEVSASTDTATASTTAYQSATEMAAMTAEGMRAALASEATAADTASTSIVTSTVATQAAIPTVAQLNAQFAAMRARLVEVGAQADAEAGQMLLAARAKQALAGNTQIASNALSGLKNILGGVGEMAGNALVGLKNMLVGVAETVGKLALYSGLIFAVLGGLAVVVAAAPRFEAIMQQTRAALKSTHDASGETVQSIVALAQAFSQVTTYSSDAVQEMENILLTFPTISKNIFPETTQAVLDLSTAMHQNLKQSAIEVGKALDDPARGLTNLRRIGVQFTDAQAAVIKELVKTGHTAEAQKLILRELEREFGGSAKAARDTFGGALAGLWHTLIDLGRTIGGEILPYLQQLIQHVTPLVQKFIDWETHTHTIKNALDGLGQTLGQVVSGFQSVFGPAQQTSSALTQVHGSTLQLHHALGHGPVAMGQYRQAMQGTHQAANPMIGVFQTIKDILNTVNTVIQTAIGIWHTISSVWQQAMTYLKPLGDFIKSSFLPIWDQLKISLAVLKPLWDQLVAAIQPAMPALRVIAEIIGAVLVFAIMIVIKTIALFVQAVVLAVTLIAAGIMSMVTVFLRVLGIISTVVNAIVGFFKWLWQQLVGGSIIPDIINGILSWFGRLKNELQVVVAFIVKWITDTWNNMVKSAVQWGTNLVNNILAGIQSAWNTLVSWVTGALQGIKNLFPHSPASEGPLVGMDQWGASMVTQLVQGMRSQLGTVRAAATDVGLAFRMPIQQQIMLSANMGQQGVISELQAIRGVLISQGRLQVGSGPISNTTGAITQIYQRGGAPDPIRTYQQTNRIAGIQTEMADRGAWWGGY